MTANSYANGAQNNKSARRQINLKKQKQKKDKTAKQAVLFFIITI